MAKDNHKEVEHECVFVGSSEDAAALQPLEPKPLPPTPELARTIALGVLNGAKGRYRRSSHFAKQMQEQDFDVFDMEYAIRNGTCVGLGEYSEEHKDHKYTFRGNIDGTDFDAVFSLSAEHDFINYPLMILITGCWKTKTGKRKKSY